MKLSRFFFYFIFTDFSYTSFASTFFLKRSFVNKSTRLRLNNGQMDDPSTNIVLSGGGARGIGYPGVYKALVDAQIMADVKSISGASAGALAAAVMAVGINPEKFREDLLQVNMATLAGQFDFFGPNIIPGFTATLEPLKNFLNQLLVNATADFLAKQPCLTEEVSDLGKHFNNSNHVMTFEELHILNQAFPRQFKNLIIPALDFITSNITFFEYTHFPKVSIALACIASSALPVKFSMVKIGNRYYQDAVLKMQLPADVFLNENANRTLFILFNNSAWDGVINLNSDEYWLKAQAQIKLVDTYYIPTINYIFFLLNLSVFLIKTASYPLIVTFFHLVEETTKANKYEKELTDLIMHIRYKPISFSQYNVSFDTFSLIRDKFKEQTVLIDSSTISTTSFFEAQDKGAILQSLGYLDTLEFLLRRQWYKGQIFENLEQFYHQIISGYHQNLIINNSSSPSFSSSQSHYKAIRQKIRSDINGDAAESLKQVVLELMAQHTGVRILQEEPSTVLNKTQNNTRHVFFSKKEQSPRFLQPKLDSSGPQK